MPLEISRFIITFQLENALFELGDLRVSTHLTSLFQNPDIFESTISKCLQNHVNGDFGIVPESESISNCDSILSCNLRVVSRYRCSLVENGIQVITQDGVTIVQAAYEY
jgi:preprotein translocase subunit Sec63